MSMKALIHTHLIRRFPESSTEPSLIESEIAFLMRKVGGYVVLHLRGLQRIQEILVSLQRSENQEMLYIIVRL
jgi:hypothetical protein